MLLESPGMGGHPFVFRRVLCCAHLSDEGDGACTGETEMSPCLQPARAPAAVSPCPGSGPFHPQPPPGLGLSRGEGCAAPSTIIASQPRTMGFMCSPQSHPVANPCVTPFPRDDRGLLMLKSNPASQLSSSQN